MHATPSPTSPFPLPPRLAAALALALVLGLGFSLDAAACSCLAPGPPAQELAAADAVFSGKVVSLEPFTEGFGKVRVTFELAAVWKGLPEGDRVTLTTAADSATCGYPFEDGVSYLVYAYGEGDDLTATLCSRTRPLADADEDLEALGDPARTCGGEQSRSQ